MKIATVITIFIGLIIGFFITIFVIEIIFFDVKPKKGLVLSASREGSLGGIWLGLYDDNHFELGAWQGNVNTIGIYTFVNDTLKLIIRKGNIQLGNKSPLSFVIEDGMLVETSKSSRIKFLGIIENRITSSTPSN